MPYAKVREHKFENLIALCPNCHTRYDRHEIDLKDMKYYKQSLAGVPDAWIELGKTVGNRVVEWSLRPYFLHEDWVKSLLSTDARCSLDNAIASRMDNPNSLPHISTLGCYVDALVSFLAEHNVEFLGELVEKGEVEEDIPVILHQSICFVGVGEAAEAHDLGRRANAEFYIKPEHFHGVRVEGSIGSGHICHGSSRFRLSGMRKMFMCARVAEVSGEVIVLDPIAIGDTIRRKTKQA